MMVPAGWTLSTGIACHLVLGFLWASHLCEALPKTTTITTTTTKTTTTEASQDVATTIPTTFTNVSTAGKEDSNEASDESSEEDDSPRNGSTTKRPSASIKDKDNSMAQVNHPESELEQILEGQTYRLKGIPARVSPDLLKFMAEAGVGDSFLLASADFPAASTARKHGIPFDRIDCTDVLTLFQDIQSLMDIRLPLILMAKDMDLHTPWLNSAEEFKRIMGSKEQKISFMADLLTYSEFIAATEKVSYIIQTSDPNMQYNVILRKEFEQGKKGSSNFKGTS